LAKQDFFTKMAGQPNLASIRKRRCRGVAGAERHNYDNYAVISIILYSAGKILLEGIKRTTLA
jgi:hypothetical protein